MDACASLLVLAPCPVGPYHKVVGAVVVDPLDEEIRDRFLVLVGVVLVDGHKRGYAGRLLKPWGEMGGTRKGKASRRFVGESQVRREREREDTYICVNKLT